MYRGTEESNRDSSPLAQNDRRVIIGLQHKGHCGDPDKSGDVAISVLFPHEAWGLPRNDSVVRPLPVVPDLFRKLMIGMLKRVQHDSLLTQPNNQQPFTKNP